MSGSTTGRTAVAGQESVAPELLAAYDYVLPADSIAQEPTARRDGARLLVLRRDDGTLRHRRVTDLPALLRPGDLLVVNDSRVRHARLTGRKESGGRVEVLLLGRRSEEADGELWTALVRASRSPGRGTEIHLDGGIVAAVESAAAEEQGGETILRLCPPPGTTVEGLLPACGQVPLPPYIRRSADDSRHALDRDRYQTVFARQTGSAAAPTAGLHLSQELLAALEEAGVRRASITLHVGRGTFQPVRASRLSQHRMHAEWCRLPAETAAAIHETRGRGGRVVAVGTTVVRPLEARSDARGVRPGEGPVDLFVRPGHRFRSVDVLMTNFHLPRSTLLVLVAAFAGRERVLNSYREALRAGYRFYSYGDAMLID